LTFIIDAEARRAGDFAQALVVLSAPTRAVPAFSDNTEIPESALAAPLCKVFFGYYWADLTDTYFVLNEVPTNDGKLNLLIKAFRDNGVYEDQLDPAMAGVS
jgi:hypothetical protein